MKDEPGADKLMAVAPVAEAAITKLSASVQIIIYKMVYIDQKPAEERN